MPAAGPDSHTPRAQALRALQETPLNSQQHFSAHDQVEACRSLLDQLHRRLDTVSLPSVRLGACAMLLQAELDGPDSAHACAPAAAAPETAGAEASEPEAEAEDSNLTSPISRMLATYFGSAEDAAASFADSTRRVRRRAVEAATTAAAKVETLREGSAKTADTSEIDPGGGGLRTIRKNKFLFFSEH